MVALLADVTAAANTAVLPQLCFRLNAFNYIARKTFNERLRVEPQDVDQLCKFGRDGDDCELEARRNVGFADTDQLLLFLPIDMDQLAIQQQLDHFTSLQ